MRVRIAPEGDAVYMTVTDKNIAESEEVADGVVIDYDAEGSIAGVEVVDASCRGFEN